MLFKSFTQAREWPPHLLVGLPLRNNDPIIKGICLRGANGESSLGAKVAEPSNEKLKALEARPYQVITYRVFRKKCVFSQFTVTPPSPASL